MRSREDPGPDGPLADMLWLLGSWLLGREQQPLVEKTIPHVTLRFRQLRTLLHLVDAEFGATDEPSIPVRSRCTHTFRMLCERVRGDTVTPLRRLTCATLARAADAVVREQVYELSDAFIAACWCVQSAFDLRCLAEACMAPEFRELFAAMAEVALLVGERSGRHADEQALVESLRGVAEALPPGSSARVEGLRRGLLGITRALEAFTEAQCVSDLRRGDDGTALDRLAGAITYAARLIAGATRRTGLREGFFPSSSTRGLRKLDAWVERALLEKDEGMGAAATVAAEAVRQDLPPLFAEVVGRVLLRIGRLPRDLSASGEMARVVRAGRQLPLPPWLPPSRTLGGFYVLRPIGTGAGGSVFVARRAEERHEESAETFALKVPAYNGAVAHTLSEEEFLRLFREEAGALLTLPGHKNLAGFVTFDAGAKPKPILVMELVQGPTLERLLDKRAMSMPMALGYSRRIGGWSGGDARRGHRPLGCETVQRDLALPKRNRHPDTQPESPQRRARTGGLRLGWSQGASRLRQSLLWRARGLGHRELRRSHGPTGDGRVLVFLSGLRDVDRHHPFRWGRVARNHRAHI